MKHTAILTIALSAIALLAGTCVTHAAERRSGVVSYADGPGQTKRRYYRRKPPLEVNIYPLRRRGGYSFSASDVVNTYGGLRRPMLTSGRHRVARSTPAFSSIQV